VVRGHVETLMSPTTTTTADLHALLDALLERAPAVEPEAAPAAAESRTAQLDGGRHLTSGQLALLNTPGGGIDPSLTGWNSLLTLASAGWSFTDVQAVVDTFPGLETYRTRRSGDRGQRRPRSAHERQRRLVKQRDGVQSHVRVRALVPTRAGSRNLTELQAQVDAIEALLDSFRVNPGRGGGRNGAPTRRTVLSALAYLTLRTGKTAVAASTRTLAELSNVSHTTAARALHALTAAGHVVRIDDFDGINAATWSLAPLRDFPQGQMTSVTQPLITTPAPAAASDRANREVFARRANLLNQLEDSLAAIQHDVFTYQGVGHLAGQIWGLMRAALTGLSKKSATGSTSDSPTPLKSSANSGNSASSGNRRPDGPQQHETCGDPPQRNCTSQGCSKFEPNDIRTNAQSGAGG
jgi:hypothetical protein